jgi:hypothetical protein
MIINKSKYGCVFCQKVFKRWEDLKKHAENIHKSKKWIKIRYGGGFRMATAASEAGSMAVELEYLLRMEGLRSR